MGCPHTTALTLAYGSARTGSTRIRLHSHTTAPAGCRHEFRAVRKPCVVRARGCVAGCCDGHSPDLPYPLPILLSSAPVGVKSSGQPAEVSMRRGVSAVAVPVLWLFATELGAGVGVAPDEAQQRDGQEAADPVNELVSRLTLDEYKATLKGLTRFGDRRQGRSATATPSTGSRPPCRTSAAPPPSASTTSIRPRARSRDAPSPTPCPGRLHRRPTRIQPPRPEATSAGAAPVPGAA